MLPSMDFAAPLREIAERVHGARSPSALRSSRPSLRRGDGDYRWYLGRALAQRDAGGAIVKWLATSTDIETAKRMIDTLRVRTEYEQQLIGIVSHDLRNPLNAISRAAGSSNRQDLGVAAGKMIQRVVARRIERRDSPAEQKPRPSCNDPRNGRKAQCGIG